MIELANKNKKFSNDQKFGIEELIENNKNNESRHVHRKNFMCVSSMDLCETKTIGYGKYKFNYFYHFKRMYRNCNSRNGDCNKKIKKEKSP